MNGSMNEKPIIAAFDFDGTMTKRDTLISFLFFTAGKWAAIKKLACLSPFFLGFVLKIVSRQTVKEAVLKSFFKGLPAHQLEEMGETFAGSANLSYLIHPIAIKRLEWHRLQKHRCLLISASVDAYLKPWSKKHGFDDLICSQLEIDKNEHVTGLLAGLNCWGPEKERRLLELAGPRENYILYAYGDSRGDEELLSTADHSFYRKMPGS